MATTKIHPKNKAAVWESIQRHLPHIAKRVQTAAADLREMGFAPTQKNLRSYMEAADEDSGIET